MTSRRDALEDIVATARAHGLSAAEIAAALEHPDARAGRGGMLARLLAYLGGTFVFAGLSVLVGLNWDVMSTGARIVATLGAGVAVFVLGLAAAGDARFARASAPLLLTGAALEGLGMLVAMDELSTGGDWRRAVLLMCLTMAAQQALALARFAATTLVFTLLVFATGAASVALDLARVPGDTNAVVVGSSLVLVALGLARSAHRGIAPLWQLVGGAACLSGLFDLLRGTPAEIAFLLAASGTVVLSVHAGSRALLVVGTIAILGYVAYFTEQRFLDSLGWPLVLIVLGLALIGVSAAALGLDRRYIGAGQ